MSSVKTAAVLSVILFLNASMLPYSMTFVPGMSGLKGARYFSLSVMLSVLRVLPWKLLLMYSTSLFLVCFLTTFIAASFASAPELLKNVFDTTGASPFNISANTA